MLEYFALPDRTRFPQKLIPPKFGAPKRVKADPIKNAILYFGAGKSIPGGQPGTDPIPQAFHLGNHWQRIVDIDNRAMRFPGVHAQATIPFQLAVICQARFGQVDHPHTVQVHVRQFARV